MSSNTPSPWVAMIRRKPTALTVTHEDIADFEARRLQKKREKEEKQQENKAPGQAEGGTAATTKDGANASASTNVAVDPSDELKPLPGDKARIVRSREERIGIGRRG